MIKLFFFYPCLNVSLLLVLCVCVFLSRPLSCLLPISLFLLSPLSSIFLTLSSCSGNVEKPLEDTNVGHQMLKKMGWEGAGLGLEEQGIQEPVKGGEVRDKVDKYKVGVVTKLNIVRSTKNVFLILRKWTDSGVILPILEKIVEN